MIDLILWLIYLLVVAAVGATVWAAWRGFRRRDASQAEHHHVPARRIALGCGVLLVVSLVLTFATGSAAPMVSNGVPFTSSLWLRLTDMFINTALLLVGVAAICVAVGRARC